METLLLLVVLLGVMYLLLVRPRQRQMAKHRELLARLAPGDRVVTIGGVHGVVAGIEGDTVAVAVSPGVEITFSREAISRTVEDDAELRDGGDASDVADDEVAGGEGTGGGDPDGPPGNDP